MNSISKTSLKAPADLQKRRLRITAIFLLAFATTVTPLSLLAQDGAKDRPGATAPADDIKLNVIERSLKNGMKVLMVERHDAPTVSLILRFKVGGVDDPKGQTGIAHLLEHMMFKGTKTYGTTDYQAEIPLMGKIDQLYAELEAERRKALAPGGKADEAKMKQLKEEMAAISRQEDKYIVNDELWQTYQRVGGVGLNASTGEDSTQYFLSLPSNQLELWAYLESDRIANPVFREFYSERDVVHEERRTRTDTEPAGQLYENFAASAYEAHPYHNPVIGWPSDLENLRREEVLQYFKTFYAPNNCIAAVVGDIDPDKTMAIIEKYFGPLPAQPQPRRFVTEEPPQTGERRVTMLLDAQPRLYIGYHTPQTGNEDTYPLEVLAALLDGVSENSRTGRLYKALVLDQKVALQVGANESTDLYPSLFSISATPAAGKTSEDVEKAIYNEIEKLAKEPPTDAELTRVRNSVDAYLLRSLRSNFFLGYSLVSAEHLAGSWKFILTERDKLKTVTAEDVLRVAKKYLVPENRTVAELRSKPRENAEGAAQASQEAAHE